MARVRLNRDEIVARVALLLRHWPRAPFRRLAAFTLQPQHELRQLLRVDVELSDIVTATRRALRNRAPVQFETRVRIERALLEIDRLDGPDSGWVDSMHPEFQPCQ